MPEAVSLEAALAEQSAILQLGNAWMEKTGGVVVPGVNVTRDEWIERVQRFPIWEEVKDDVGSYIPLMRLRSIKSLDANAQCKNVYLLENALSLNFVLDHFLADPDYHQTSTSHSFGTPRNFVNVLRDYSTSLNEGKGGIKKAKGDCHKISNMVRLGRLSDDEVLASVDKVKIWNKYWSSTGISREFRSLTKKTLDHFLANTDYHTGQGPVEFGRSRDLKDILSSYRISLNEGAGGIDQQKGDCAKVCAAVRRGLLTEDKLLDSIDMRTKWREYKDSVGIPRKFSEIAKSTLEHFLRNPSYCSEEDRHHETGRYRELGYVLRNYSAKLNEGTGGFETAKGECNKIYATMGRHSRNGPPKNGFHLTEDSLLEYIGLKQAWADYQASSADRPFVYRPERYQRAA